MRGKSYILVAAMVVALALTGCGGGDGDDESSREKLKVSRASADVEEFCRVYRAEGYIFNRPYLLMLQATDTLIAASRSDPDMKVWLDPSRPEVPVRKVVRNSAAKLKRCGPDGRQQAARLQRATSPD